MEPQALHRDQLGSVRAVTGFTALALGASTFLQRLESAIYTPFGAQSETRQPAQTTEEQKGFIGQRYDADAGLQYLNARYYDPLLGMFIQPDWWEVTKPGVGTNRYSYSFNDPVNKMDPGGNLAFLAAVPPLAELAGLAGLAGLLGLAYSIEPDPAPGIGHEGYSTDPSASDPTVLGNPMDDGSLWSNVEGMTPGTDSGPSVVSTPVGVPSDLDRNIVEASELRGALGLTKGDGLIAHHNIPQQHKNHPAVEAAVRAGFEIHGAKNGTKVVGQAGGHPEYNRRIGQDLQDAYNRGLLEEWTDEEFREEVESISDRERDRIEGEGGYVRNY